ncbi:MAG: VCBS repeat-containing protein, partial [Acidobacteria bacterium]|nr:VCBS repeat-containing protein [Acidobacteriota bacterium]
FPYVEPLDLDGDGAPEIVVSLSSARGREADWLFKWSGRGLRLIGPSTVDDDGDVSTVLGDADFVDINGDGFLEIINPPEEDPDEPFDVFDLDGNRLKPINFVGTYLRGAGKPTESVEIFPASRGDYLLKIINGDAKGDHRVSSAVVRLNGRVVVGPNELSQNVSEISVRVSLQGSNTLGVELRSAPDSQITLSVGPQ